MSAYQELKSLYQEWRRLSEAEGKAIRLNEWLAVNECQSAKYKLQACITLATETFLSDAAKEGRDAGEYDRQFRGTVAELIQLEERNGLWLEDQMRHARQQQEELSRSARNLRQVHRAYAAAESAAWHSYS
jgi:hypothetical protein